jgi:acyl-coenzyme A thioesterase PaaI-like protein
LYFISSSSIFWDVKIRKTIKQGEKMTDLKNFKGTVMELLGIEHREITKEKIVLTMPVTPKTHHPWGALHGGYPLSLPKQRQPWVPV